jgi:hypothetical protein
MPKVTLTRADWEFVVMLLEDNPGYVSDPLLKEINDQLDRQEY